MGDQDHIAENLFAYIQAFSPCDDLERFEFHTQIERMKRQLPYLVTEKFANTDCTGNGQYVKWCSLHSEELFQVR